MKPWYQSKTILGLLIMALGTLAQQTGYTWSDEDAINAAEALGYAGEAIGLALGIYGRIKVNQPIGGGGGARMAALLILGGLLVATGCANNDPAKIAMPQMVPGANGHMVPLMSDGKVVMNEMTLPADSAHFYFQYLLATTRRPQMIQTFDEQGRVKSQEFWGENGRSEMRDMDPRSVKLARVIVPPLVTAATAGVVGYLQVEGFKTFAGAIQSVGAGAKTVNITGDGNVYANESLKGAGSYLGIDISGKWSSSQDDHSSTVAGE